MRKLGFLERPKWTYYLIPFYAFIFIGNLLVLLSDYGLHFTEAFDNFGMIMESTHLAILVLLSLELVAFVSLFWVSRFTWGLSILTLLGALFYGFNFSLAEGFQNKLQLVFLAVNICLLYVFTFSRYRTPYLRSRLRWWLTRPRYSASEEVEIIGAQERARLLNISQSGAFLELDNELDVPEVDTIGQVSLFKNLLLAFEVKRKTKNGVGIHFINLDTEDKAILQTELANLESEGKKLR